FFIGKPPGDLGVIRRLVGAVDDVRVQGRHLLASEIAKLASRCTSTLVRWPRKAPSRTAHAPGVSRGRCAVTLGIRVSFSMPAHHVKKGAGRPLSSRRRPAWSGAWNG